MDTQSVKNQNQAEDQEYFEDSWNGSKLLILSIVGFSDSTVGQTGQGP
jgi:hypothetical protein